MERYVQFDGNMKAAFTHTATSLEVGGYQPILLSAHTPLKIGEKIGICLAHGELYDDGQAYDVTRFSCICLAAEEKKYDWWSLLMSHIQPDESVVFQKWNTEIHNIFF